MHPCTLSVPMLGRSGQLWHHQPPQGRGCHADLVWSVTPTPPGTSRQAQQIKERDPFSGCGIGGGWGPKRDAPLCHMVPTSVQIYKKGFPMSAPKIKKSCIVALCAVFLLCSACADPSNPRGLLRFKQLKIEFIDGTEATYSDFRGGVEGRRWVIQKDGKEFVHPMTAIKTYEWKLM